MSRYVYLIVKTSKDGNELNQSTYVFTNKKDALRKFFYMEIDQSLENLRKYAINFIPYGCDGEKDNFYCKWLSEDFSKEYTYITFKKIKLEEKYENVIEYTNTFAFKKEEEENGIHNNR